MKILDKLKGLKICEKNSGSIWSIPPCGKKRNLGGRDRCCHACGRKILIPCDSEDKVRTFQAQSFVFFRFSKVHWWLRLRLVSAPSLFHFHLHLIPKFVWSFYNNCGNISVCVGGVGPPNLHLKRTWVFFRNFHWYWKNVISTL